MNKKLCYNYDIRMCRQNDKSNKKEVTELLPQTR